MKKILALACAVFCLAALGACGAQSSENETKLNSLESQAGDQAMLPSEQVTLSTTTNATTGSTRLPEEKWVVQNRVIPAVLPVLEPEAIQLLPAEQLEMALWPVLLPGESYPDIPLYFRYCYYESYGHFWTVVGLDISDGVPHEFSVFLDSLPRTEDFYPNGTAQEMPLVTLIKHFQVPKHVFVAKVEEMREAWLASGDDLSAEINELPNADIIYTFDNEIINEYYRRR